MLEKIQAHSIDRYVGQKLRYWRQVRDLTQTEVARRIGVTFQQVQKYERGTNWISVGRLYDIAAALGVGVMDLLPPAPASVRAREAEIPRDLLLLLRVYSRIKNATNCKRVRQVAAIFVERAE